MGGVAAKRIGAELRRAMKLRNIDVRGLAELTGKQVDHVDAVVNGYPNSIQRPTQLDTVDEIAAALGRKLDLNVADKEG
jgi:hypothetical protein